MRNLTLNSDEFNYAPVLNFSGYNTNIFHHRNWISIGERNDSHHVLFTVIKLVGNYYAI